jgi:uncharacterized protein (DUF2062 family)
LKKEKKPVALSVLEFEKNLLAYQSIGSFSSSAIFTVGLGSVSQQSFNLFQKKKQNQEKRSKLLRSGVCSA